uniref:hypothetical protein n=1 Tax=Cupriavidus necator TaxID=106590 RepID=UPI003F491F7B
MDELRPCYQLMMHVDANLTPHFPMRLAVRVVGDENGVAVRTLAEHKLRVVEERLRDLRILRTELRKLTSQCRANRDKASFPLVEVLLCDAS